MGRPKLDREVTVGEARRAVRRGAVRSCSELYSRTAIDLVAAVFIFTNATARSSWAAAVGKR